MKTILAEKPSVARTIASVVGARHRNDGYLSGSGFNVTWAIGHLVGLSMPQDYGFEKWSLEHLPIIPEDFKLKINEEAGIQKQFKVIKSLFSASNMIIVATDAGREGELIYRYIHQMANPPGHIQIQRLWISDLTESTIRKGMADLRPISEYDHLYYAAKARNQADWLVGINFTQGYTLASGKRKPLSIGRVQTATLRLVVDRFKENKSFTSQSFFVPQLIIEDTETPVVLACESKFKTENEAIGAIEEIKGIDSPPIHREDKEIQEVPPLPYDLTTLQRTANKALKYTAQDTLTTVQSLYEKHKVVSYPRTESEHLATSQKDEVLSIFNDLPGFEFNGIQTDSIKENCLYNIPESKVFNDSKVTDHHAIIPTGKHVALDILNEKERNIYLMIVKRFFQSFLFPCKKANRKLSVRIGDLVFSASATQIIQKGWRELTEAKEPETSLPETNEGETRMIIDSKVYEGKTKPKALYTESALLGSMETAGQLVADKSIREGLKERGLGTPATRATIIETLIKREYVVREKSKLVPTEIGIGLIGSLKDLTFSTPELTGEWEFKLKQVERKELGYDKFMEQIKAYVSSVFPEVLSAAEKVKDIQTGEERKRNLTFGKCPKCNSGEIRKGKKSFFCSNWNQEPKCDFTIWNITFNKKLSDTLVKELLSKGTTRTIKGFKSKAGKPFEAKLTLDDDKRVKPVFERKFK